MAQPACPTVRYRKKPVEVDTVQWTGGNIDELIDFTGGNFLLVDEGERLDPEITAKVYDELHTTWVLVKTGQHVVRGVKGEFYPIAEDVLAETYEPVDTAPLSPADRAAEPVCICGHPEQRHFEDVCLTCGCGDYLEPGDAAEVIARWRQAAVTARATIERVRRLHDALGAETALTSPEDEITRGAAARKIAAALDGWTDPAELRRLAGGQPAQDEAVRRG